MAKRTFDAGITGIQSGNKDIKVTLSLAHESAEASAIGGWLLEAQRHGESVKVTIETMTVQLSFFSSAIEDIAAEDPEIRELAEMEGAASNEAAAEADAEERELEAATV